MTIRYRTAICCFAAACSVSAGAWATCADCDGDIDGNGVVDTTDLLAMLADWGPCPGCPGDINGDETVDTIDLLLQLTGWGDCPTVPFCASYTFDDGTASDDTGNGHDGVIFGNPASVPGVLGLALELDGTGDHVIVQSSPLLEFDTVVLSAWILIPELPAAEVTILEKRSGDRGYNLRLRADGWVRLRVWSPEGLGAVTSSWPVVPGVWTSIFAAYDGSSARLWLQGSLSGTEPVSDPMIANDGPLIIGAADDGTASWFGGTLDEIRIGSGLVQESVMCAEALKVWADSCGLCLDALVDVTADLNLGDTAHRHFGVCIVDANNDGWVDLYYANGFMDPDLKVIPPSGECPDETDPPFDPASNGTFYLNQGDGTFTEDVAPAAGIDDFWNAMRHTWGDYDNDGYRDLISHNFVKSTLYRAIPGTDPRVFVDAGLELCLGHGTGASWVDVDNDGFLDLYACEYDASRDAVDHVAKLLLNNQDGSFADVTSEAGMDLPDNPMGIAFADYDNDGDQDVYITNSHEAPTRLYRNDGVVDGIPRFTDVATEVGVEVPGDDGSDNKGIGCGWGDYNNDGLLDLIFVREAGSRLFRNDGPTEGGGWSFTDMTDVGGLNLTDAGAFWGGNFVDIDNDGWLDIFMANRVSKAAKGNTANSFYMNRGDGTWCEVAGVLGVQLGANQQMGIVPGDLDNDGDLDLVLTSHKLGTPNVVLRNEARGNSWVQFRLQGTVSNRDAVGARIEVTAVLAPGEQPTTQIREVVAGTGFFSDIPRIKTFGLGKAASIQNATIRWPSGTVQNLGKLSVGQRYDIVEPTDG